MNFMFEEPKTSSINSFQNKDLRIEVSMTIRGHILYTQTSLSFKDFFNRAMKSKLRKEFYLMNLQIEILAMCCISRILILTLQNKICVHALICDSYHELYSSPVL